MEEEVCLAAYSNGMGNYLVDSMGVVWEGEYEEVEEYQVLFCSRWVCAGCIAVRLEQDMWHRDDIQPLQPFLSIGNDRQGVPG